MNKFLKLLLMLVILNGMAFGQNAKNDSPSKSTTSNHGMFAKDYEMPSFPGGEDKLFAFIKKKLKYPKEAKKERIQGTVQISFMINAEGKIFDVMVLKGIGYGCDEEAIRIVKIMPVWIPGKQNGKEVPVRFNLPVKFSL